LCWNLRRNSRHGSRRRNRRRRRYRPHGRSRNHWTHRRRKHRPLNRRRSYEPGSNRQCCGRWNNRARNRRSRSGCLGHRRRRDRGLADNGRRRRNRGGRMRHRRRHTRRRRRRSLFPLRDRLQHISRPGDVRQVNLGFDFVFAAQCAGGSRRGSRFSGRAEVHPYLFCFEVFQRTGMGLLLGHPDCL
jgi:hypothetical protein